MQVFATPEALMSNLLIPLSNEELQQLDTLLFARLPDEENLEEDAEEGVLDVSELDGLCTALVSGPELPEPEEWLPLLWGDFEPEWDGEGHYDAVMALLIRHLNTLAATLAEAPQDFEPLFMSEEQDGEEVTVVDGWCEGYLKGVALGQARWKSGGSELQALLRPLRLFSSATDWAAHTLPAAEFERQAAALVPNARAIHAFWHARRKPAATKEKTATRPRSTPGKPHAGKAPSPWKKS